MSDNTIDTSPSQASSDTAFSRGSTPEHASIYIQHSLTVSNRIQRENEVTPFCGNFRHSTIENLSTGPPLPQWQSSIIHFKFNTASFHTFYSTHSPEICVKLLYGGRLSACCVWFYLVDFRRFIGHSRVCMVIFCIK